MAHSNQAKKRVRQNLKRRMHNRSQKTRIKTFRKRFLKSIEEENKEEAGVHLAALQSLLDKAAKTNLIHKNKVNRDKSRMRQRLNEMA